MEKTGKTVRKWKGFYYVYVDGVRTGPNSKILGRQADLTKGQAEDKLRAIIRKVEAADGIASGGEVAITSFGEACDLYQKNKADSGTWCPNWAKNIGSLFSVHVSKPLGKFKPDQLRTTYLQTWINGIALNGLCKDSVHHLYTHVKAVFEMLVDDDLLSKNPMRKVEIPETRDRCDRILSLEEIHLLIPELSADDQLVIEIFLSCAVRPSETFAFRKNDIREDDSLMIDEAAIPGEGFKDTKTKASKAPVPIGNAGLAMRLKQRAANLKDDDLLFPNSRGGMMDHQNWLQRKLQPAAKRAGIKGVTQQCLRRTIATMMPKHGQPKASQGLLRHASIITTMDVYTKKVDADVAAASESLRGQLNFDGVLMVKRKSGDVASSI